MTPRLPCPLVKHIDISQFCKFQTIAKDRKEQPCLMATAMKSLDTFPSTAKRLAPSTSSWLLIQGERALRVVAGLPLQEEDTDLLHL